MRPVQSFTKGFALCTPSGTLLGHTYRETEQAAIECLFAVLDWSAKKTEGWSVEHVYARVFSPRFFLDVIPEPADG